MLIPKVEIRAYWAVILGLAACLCSAPSLGTARFNHISMEDGLSNNEVLNVIQDHDGYLWFATGDGINRYDGYTFKTFRHDPSDPGSLSENFVRALYEDPKGRLWVGTFSSGLNLYDPNTGSFKHYRH